MIDPTLAARLAALAERPLSGCPRFPEIAARWEAWWRFAADRPLIIGAVRGDGLPPSRTDRCFDLLDDPERWLAARREQVERTFWVDQSVPFLRLEYGPVATAGFLGAPVHFARDEDTAWTDPVLLDEEWDGDVPRPDAAAGRLARAIALAHRTARAAAGNFLVGLPDLSGPPDILASLRGTERLLLDLHDRPEAVRRACADLVDGWHVSFEGILAAILVEGAGPSSWLHAWSPVPYTVPTCDFNALLGPEAFERFCLPSIAEQSRRAGRSLFHLDGPDAARHAASLARCDAVTAVQYTPGAGTPSALERLALLRLLQEAGKPILVICPAAETRELCRRLDPRGLVLWPEGLESAAQARDLVAGAVGVR